jgi:hypothetical protein
MPYFERVVAVVPCWYVCTDFFNEANKRCGGTCCGKIRLKPINRSVLGFEEYRVCICVMETQRSHLVGIGPSVVGRVYSCESNVLDFATRTSLDGWRTHPLGAQSDYEKTKGSHRPANVGVGSPRFVGEPHYQISS